MRLATILPQASLVPVPVAALEDGNWVELAALVGKPVTRIEESLTWILGHAARLAERARDWRGPRYRRSEFMFLPPVPRPPELREFEAFEEHARACWQSRGGGLPPNWRDAPLFHFGNRLALVGNESMICAPGACFEFDFGLCLGVIIGRKGRDIAPSQAWRHVAGLTILNGFCARDLERKAFASGQGPCKGRDFATAAGPWLTLLDEVHDRIQGETLDLQMRATVNGRQVSHAASLSMTHSIPSLVAEASRDADLFPGDLLSSGPVGGGSLLECGSHSWLSPGDCVQLEVERLGILETRIGSRSIGPEETPFLWSYGIA